KSKHETETYVKLNPTLHGGEEQTLPLHDYLNPRRIYSNRSTIKLPGGFTKKCDLNLNYYIMVSENPFRGLHSEHPQDHIENLEELLLDDYNRCKLFPFSLEGEARKRLNCLPAESLTYWNEIRGAFLLNFF